MLGDWGRTYGLLIGEAEAMPEDKYGFKPTPAQQNFGERLMHVAMIDVKLVSTLGGTAAEAWRIRRTPRGFQIQPPSPSVAVFI